METTEKSPDLKDFQFNLVNDEDDLSVNIAGYHGEDEHITIPGYVQGLKINKIDSEAFKGNDKVKRITIEKSISVIESNAFEDCSELTEIELPDGLLEIGNDAFKGCKKLSKIQFPESILTISNNAFENCEELTSVFIPKEVYRLYENTFSCCVKLKEFIVDNRNLYYSTNDGVLFNKTQDALIKYPEGKKDTSYKVPDTVIDIRAESFINCKKLIDVTLPGRFFGLCAGTFKGCENLEKVTVQDGNPIFLTIDGVLFDKKKKTLLFYPFNKKGTEYAIPDGIERIKIEAFFNCKNLETVSFPESLKMIERGAFANCENLLSITLPANLKGICAGAFCGCKQLKKVTLSRKTRIGYGAFGGLSAEFVYLD